MTVLDPYQIKFEEEIKTTLGRYRRIIACGATGCGKTKIFIDITEKAIAKGRTVLILTESIKIFNQVKAEILCTLINPKNKQIYLQRNSAFIAMAQTLSKRKELIDQLVGIGGDLLVIVDEAHMGHFSKLLKELKDALLIGFTATPDARWARHLPEFYKAIVVGPQPDELIQMGFLAPYKHFARVGADLDQLALQNGDFSEESQEKAFGNNKVFEGLIEDLKTIKYRKCLIFTASIKDCETVHNQLESVGLKCTFVHSKMSDESFIYSLGQFQKGDISICISVGTLTKGFDFPAIDLIVLRRATTSLPLYLQMIGRGSRKRGVDWKKFFTVLDYGGNYLRHGLWDMDREWEDLWNKPRKAKDGVAPVKLCPQCEYISCVNVEVCPNCGYEFVKKDIPLEVGKLIEITENYTKIVGKTMSQLTPEELSTYAKFKNKKNFAARIAVARDRQKPGFLAQYGKCMEYKNSWPEFKAETMKREAEIRYPDFILK